MDDATLLFCVAGSPLLRELDRTDQDRLRGIHQHGAGEWVNVWHGKRTNERLRENDDAAGCLYRVTTKSVTRKGSWSQPT